MGCKRQQGDREVALDAGGCAWKGAPSRVRGELDAEADLDRETGKSSKPKAKARSGIENEECFI